MPFTFNCSQCGNPIEAREDMAGKRGRCPHCSFSFVIPEPHHAERDGYEARAAVTTPPSVTAPSPADRDYTRAAVRQPEPEEFERPDEHDSYDRFDRFGRAGRRLARGWRTVRSGLSLMRVSMIICVFVVLAMVLFFALSLALGANAGRNRQAGAVMGVAFALGGLTGLVALILFVVGQCLCCAAPEQSRAGARGAKGAALGSVICLFLAVGLVLLGLLFLAIASGQRGRGRGDGLAILAAGVFVLTFILAMISHVLLVLFLRRTARYFRNDSLAYSAGNYAIVFVVFIVLALVLQVLAIVVGNANRFGPGFGIFMLILAAGLLIFLLVLFLWFLDLLGRSAALITRADEEGC